MIHRTIEDKVIEITKYIMTSEEFEKASHNTCKDFRPNHYTNEVI